MLAYLLLLYDPAPPPFIGIEEPENFLHPRLLPGLAEECRGASGRGQLLVTTHSPFFINALRPERSAGALSGRYGLYASYARFGDKRRPRVYGKGGIAWRAFGLRDIFGVGDPLVNQGAPTSRLRSAG